jgi:nitrogen fixation NifU-like protein
MAYVEKVLRTSGYSNKAIGFYINKVNLGICDDADVSFGYTGPCGDTMELFLKVEGHRIQDAKFQAIGCEGALICGSAITKMITGGTVEQAANIEKDQIIEYLEGLPEAKHDCACLAITTLLKTLQEFREHHTHKKR